MARFSIFTLINDWSFHNVLHKSLFTLIKWLWRSSIWLLYNVLCLYIYIHWRHFVCCFMFCKVKLNCIYKKLRKCIYVVLNEYFAFSVYNVLCLFNLFIYMCVCVWSQCVLFVYIYNVFFLCSPNVLCFAKKYSVCLLAVKKAYVVPNAPLFTIKKCVLL